MTGPQLGMMSPHAAKDSLWLRLVVFYQHCHPERLKDSILDEIIEEYTDRESELVVRLYSKYRKLLSVTVDREQARKALQLYRLRDRLQLFQQEKTAIVIPKHPVEEERVTENFQKLDFTSSQFDAQLALSMDNALPIPSPDMRALDNISKCRFFLPKSCEGYTPSVAVDPPPKPPPKIPPILSLGGTGLLRSVMDDTVTRCGPFRSMYRMLDERCVTAVLIRNATGIRGVCMGILRAFDRHMNLHLSNVVEDLSFKSACLRKVRKDNNPPCPKPRRMKQLIIRGDMIALIWKSRDGGGKQRTSGRNLR